jgi:hypothetical protein
MIIDYCRQGSPEWFAARVGIPGASSFEQIVTMKGERSTQRQKLLYKLAGERLLGQKEDSYSNTAMQRGIELEPEARSVFEMTTELEVQEVGFCFFDERRDRGCSPDGLIGNHAGLEIKCPSLPVHIEYLIGGKLPAAYYQQVHGSMLMTDRESWHFFSYYPGLKPFHILVERDITFCQILNEHLEKFCKELNEITAKLRGLI